MAEVDLPQLVLAVGSRAVQRHDALPQPAAAGGVRMIDLYDLEAEMLAEQGHGAEWEAKVERARERHAAFLALTVPAQIAVLHSPCDQTCLIRGVRRVAMGPFQEHGRGTALNPVE